MNQFLTETLSDKFGQKSSKRLSGMTLMLIGTIEKIILFFMGLFNEISSISELDNSANWFVVTGSALVFGSVLEVFGNNKPRAKNEDAWDEYKKYQRNKKL